MDYVYIDLKTLQYLEDSIEDYEDNNNIEE